jgi:hypothetical protein
MISWLYQDNDSAGAEVLKFAKHFTVEFFQK